MVYTGKGGYTGTYRSTFYIVEPDANGFGIYDSKLLLYTGDKTDIIVPDGVTRIVYGTFGDNYLTLNDIESVVLPESIEKIELSYEWRAVKNIYYPGSEEQWDRLIYLKDVIPNDCKICCNYSLVDTHPKIEMTCEYGDKKDITFKWTAVPGAVKYGVYRVENGKYIKLDLNVTETSYTLTGLDAGTEYTFFVQAYTTKWLAAGDGSCVVFGSSY